MMKKIKICVTRTYSCTSSSSTHRTSDGFMYTLTNRNIFNFYVSSEQLTYKDIFLVDKYVCENHKDYSETERNPNSCDYTSDPVKCDISSDILAMNMLGETQFEDGTKEECAYHLAIDEQYLVELQANSSLDLSYSTEEQYYYCALLMRKYLTEYGVINKLYKLVFASLTKQMNAISSSPTPFVALLQASHKIILNTIVNAGWNTSCKSIVALLAMECAEMYRDVVKYEEQSLTHLFYAIFNHYFKENTICSSASPQSAISYKATKRIAVAKNAFNTPITEHLYENGVGKLVFENTLTHLGEYAFKEDYSGQKSITIPNSVNFIGERSFNLSELTEIDIDNNLTIVKNNAFQHCSKLSIVNITSVANWCAVEFENFYSNPLFIAHTLRINGEDVSTLVIPEGVTTIKAYTFVQCENISSIVFPNSLETIEDSAFYGCENITSITLPHNLHKIGASAFRGCKNLQGVTIPQGVTHIGESAFEGCINLSAPILPPNLTFLGAGAFRGCVKLQKMSIPSGVEYIGDATFNGCINLEEINLPEKIIRIGHKAFAGCSKLTNIPISSHLSTIGNRAFAGCVKWEGISIPYNVHSIGGGAFEGCNGRLQISAKAIELDHTEDTSLNNTHWLKGSNFQRVTIGSEVHRIGDYQFCGCEDLVNVVMVQCTHIGKYAFGKCAKLKNVYIPSTVTAIEDGAFEKCHLEGVFIPSISKWCNIHFGNNESNPLNNAKALYEQKLRVQDLDIPEGITSIGQYTFVGTWGCNSITIPQSLLSVGLHGLSLSVRKVCIQDLKSWCEINFENPQANPIRGADLYINGVKTSDLVFPQEITTIGNYAFYNSRLQTITFPYNDVTIGKMAFCETELKRINGVYSSDDNHCLIVDGVLKAVALDEIYDYSLPVGITSIEDNCFRSRYVKSLKLPQGIRTIGDYAFADCGYLETINIPEGVQTIGKFAFADCYSIKELHFPQSLVELGDGFLSCRQTIHIDSPQIRRFSGKYATEDGCAVVCDNVLKAYISTDSRCIKLSNDITTVGTEAFMSSRMNARAIEIPQSFTTVREDAFISYPAFDTVFCNNELLKQQIETQTNEYWEGFLASNIEDFDEDFDEDL